jgi:hypothetical protein
MHAMLRDNATTGRTNWDDRNVDMNLVQIIIAVYCGVLSMFCGDLFTPPNLGIQSMDADH